MRKDTPDFSELTPEMIKYHMDQGRRMRAIYAQYLVKKLFSSLSGIAGKAAKTLLNAAHSVNGTVGRTSRMRSSDPAKP